MPDGSRILERSTKDGHTHDMDHIDSIKRNSGVRSLVLDPFFNSWEPATIMAYLRDPDHFVNGRDMLTEAGGKYLERREIMNIFSQNLRKLYPGIDVSAIKKEQDKYKAMKTCNYKGCNRSFQDGKALMAHRKIDHPASEGRRHDHSHRQYTCPTKGCHRKKKSKGFPSLLALREHQLKMEHWGSGTYHTDEGPTPCPPVLEGETYEDLQAAVGVDEDMMDDTGKAMASHQPDDASPDPDSQHPDVSQLANASSSLSIPQQSLPATDNPLLPLLAAHGVQSLQQGNMLPIDPAMHSQPLQQQNLASELAQADDLQRQAMVARYQALQAEMAQLKNALSL